MIECVQLPDIKIPAGAKLWEHCFKAALFLNRPVALWKLPGAPAKHAAVDFTSDLNPVDFSFENFTGGFVVSPFNNDALRQTYFIKADLFISDDLHCVLNIPKGSDAYNTANAFLDLDKDLYKDVPLPVAPGNFPDDNKGRFQKIIETALTKIKEGAFKKVIIARQKKLLSAIPTDAPSVFNALCEAYPAAFVSLLYHPQVGCWTGASPEMLVSLDKHQIFRTVALAGTQKITSSADLSQITWSHKEIEEQALVNRFVINCFKSIRLREYEDDGPRTVAAGPLAHLQTDFSVDMKAVEQPFLGTSMLRLLHPTSAVCGMPRKESLEFIVDNEKFDRTLYSGFLGPVNILNESNVFVNIRCGRLFQNAAVLYAGAGITKDSDPEREWIETEDKLQVLETCLQK
jgi:isochorismate synthase